MVSTGKGAEEKEIGRFRRVLKKEDLAVGVRYKKVEAVI